MRVLGEEFFGREVTLPRLQISYRVQNSLQGGAALQGREAQYSLVPVPIRVLVARACRRGRHPRHAGRYVRRRRRAAVPIEPAAHSRGRGVRAGRADGGDAGRARGGEAACDGGDAAADGVAGSCAARGFARAWCRAGRESERAGTATLRAARRRRCALRARSRCRVPSAIKRSIAIRRRPKDRSPPAPGLSMLRGKRTVLSASVTPDTTAVNGKSASAPNCGDRSASRWARSRPCGTAVDGGSRRHGARCGAAEGAGCASGGLRLTQWRRFGRSRRHAETTTARQTWAR